MSKIAISGQGRAHARGLASQDGPDSSARLRPAPYMAQPVYLNGKYLAQRTTGVQRVADNLVNSLDQALMASTQATAQPWVLLHPRGVTAPALTCIRPQPLGPSGLGLHLWEQTLLPLASRDGLLLSFAGSAPWLARRQGCMIHDAAVWDHPEAYRRAFTIWYRLLFGHLAASADLLLTPSAFSRSRLQHHLDCDRFEVLHGSGDHIDQIRSEPLVLQRLDLLGKRYLLSVASSNPTKNLARLLLAFEGWEGRSDISLVLVGGASTSVFRPQETASHAPGVRHAGNVSDGELKSLYENALALVFPSLYEGFGLPPLEAMRCGCPVLAGSSGSLPEVCGDAAHYVDAEDVLAIRAGMQRLSEDTALVGRLRAAGFRHAATYDWRKSARRLMDSMQNAALAP